MPYLIILFYSFDLSSGHSILYSYFKMRRSLVWYSLSLLQASVRAAWPDKPFTTSGRDIISASGETVVYAGVNWPGAADVMIPEGLQYASISDTVSKFKSLGINAIRLTYAIEMIDDILDNGGDVTIADALTKALGSENGTIVLNEILTQNPQFTNSTTRLQVSIDLETWFLFFMAIW